MVDTVESLRESTLTFVFNLHPDVAVTAADKHVDYPNDTIQLCHRWASSIPCNAEVAKGKCIIGFEEQPIILEMRIEDCVTPKSTMVRINTEPGITSCVEQT